MIIMGHFKLFIMTLSTTILNHKSHFILPIVYVRVSITNDCMTMKQIGLSVLLVWQ